MERTLLIIKPDGVQRSLIGSIIDRFERKGLKVVGLKLTRLSNIQAEELYSVHKGKLFYKPLIEFITSAPIVAVALEGKDAIQAVRKLMGATDPIIAEPGSLRGDYSMDMRHNLVHASDSLESFKREFKIVFNDDEVYDYIRCDEKVMYSD